MYFKIYFVLHVCLFFNFVYCEKYSNFFSVDEDRAKISEKCMIKIIRNNIDCGTSITVITEKNVDSLLKALSNDECYNIITGTFYSRERFVWNDHVVILMKDIFKFETGIDNLRDFLLWNTNAKYIIQIPNIQSGEEVATVLLKHNIFNVVFLEYSQNGNTKIFTYYPFKYGNCAGDDDTIVCLGLCRDNISVLNIFSNKIPDKFNKCTIKVARYEDIPNVILESSNYTFRGKRLPGLEEYILESIGANKGYLIDYIEVEKGEMNGVVLENGTVTGILKYLENEEADIAIGGFVLMWNRAQAFDYIWGHHFGGVSIFTAIKPANEWKLVYKEYSSLTWVLIAAFCCLFVVVFSIYNIKATFVKDRQLLILKLWGYFYANTNNRLYKKKKIRGILLCWIWFTFFISNFYNTAFYSLTTEQHRRIHHVHKSDLTNYKPCISDSIRTLFIYAFNQTWSRKNALSMCDDREYSLEIVASRTDLFSVEMRYRYEMTGHKYVDADGNNMLDATEYSKAMAAIAMFTTKGFPLKDMIQIATRNMEETGLLQAHLQTIRLRSLRALHAKKKLFKNQDLDTFVPLYLLLCGLLIALIAFILEVVCKKSDLVFKYRRP